MVREEDDGLFRISRRETRRDIRLELRRFLLSGEPFPATMWVRGWELGHPLVTYLRIGRAFRKSGLHAALKMLPPISVRRPERVVESMAAAFCARDAAWRLTGLARTVAGPHLCLQESLGVAAALRQLGFPVQIVIGYPLIELPDGRDELHAWPALGALPLTGRSITSAGNYAELIRLPAGEAPWTIAPAHEGGMLCS